MNMSEKVGTLGRELYRVDVLSHGSENLYESNVLLDSFVMTKMGHGVIIHVIGTF